MPEVFFGGASSVAEDVAARNVDVYLLWGEPPTMARERIDRVREKAEAQGRKIRFGMRLHVITRDTEREAWAEAERLLDTMDPALIDAAQQLLQKSESVGQQRMLSLHNGSVKTSRSARISGRGSGWSVPAQAQHWSGATGRWPSVFSNTTTWGSTSSSSPGIPTSKRPTPSAKGCFHS